MKKSLLLLLFMMMANAAAQQESSFSHYMYNHQTVNPAYVGSRGVANFSSVIRSQWTGIEGAPLTQAIAYSQPLSSKNIGFGLSVLNDKIGPINNTSFDVDLAYHLRLSKNNHRLAVGLKASAISYFLNTDILTTGSPNDPAFLLDKAQNIEPNIGFGFYYYAQRFYLGFAVPRLLTYKEYGLEQHFYLMGGALISLSDNFMLKPSLLLRQTKRVASYDFSLLGIINENFWIGGQLRNNFNAETFQRFSGTGTSVLLGIQLGKNIALGYAYGFPAAFINKGLNATTHEVFLRIDLSAKTLGYLRSPRFF
ncbi:MAG: PorP/SprF family type IX secretion system membrane protein [Flavobacteriaceae bacterium]